MTEQKKTSRRLQATIAAVQTCCVFVSNFPRRQINKLQPSCEEEEEEEIILTGSCGPATTDGESSGLGAEQQEAGEENELSTAH